MADRILKLRELNRATLARQMLLERATFSVPTAMSLRCSPQCSNASLERATFSVPTAIERLVGLQAQLALPPYVGLWTRLGNFRRETLAHHIETRQVIKATLMRATLHLFTAEDYLRFRTTLQPALTGAGSHIAKRFGAEFDLGKLLLAAGDYIGEKPRTFAEISEMVAKLMPDIEVGPLRYTVRTHLPLVQVPINSGWGYSNKPAFTLAETWIGRPIPTEDNLRELVFRYLAALGPASATDMQTWSGLPKLKDIFAKLKPELQTYRDEGRRELFDLPDQSLPEEDAPAPVRFLPEFDNLLLSHSNRTRVIADEHRAKVYLPGLRVAATILVDGFVRGRWKIEKNKTSAALIIEPFDKLSKRDRAALIEEGELLLRFVEAQAKSFEVRFAEVT